jgi:hypothetical protein
MEGLGRVVGGKMEIVIMWVEEATDTAGSREVGSEKDS